MRSILAAFSGLILVAACGNGTTAATEEVEWEGTIQGMQGWEHLSGVSTVSWTVGMQQFTTTMQIAGDEQDAVRPWHVHHNTCAASGGIVGNDGDYPRLEIGADGTAAVSTGVPTGLSVAAPYHVNVHLSDDEMDVIIACGDLTIVGNPPAGSGGPGVPGEPGGPEY
jgi:hypothetical protein